MINLTLNPGYLLREELSEIFPFTYTTNSYIFKIDNAIYGDDEFAKLSYYSSLNYLIRRILDASDFIKRKFNQDPFTPDKYVQEIRKYVRTNYQFPETTIESIHSLIIQSLIERNKELSSAKKRKVLEIGEKRDFGCYICGKHVIYNKTGYATDHPDLAEVEHLWPKSLGGSNELFNLGIACKYCNHTKTDHIDYSDYHYEKFSIISDKEDEKFKFDFTKEYKNAIYIKNNNECAQCGRKALHRNRMNFCRADISDSWHYLNILTYCDNHVKE